MSMLLCEVSFTFKTREVTEATLHEPTASSWFMSMSHKERLWHCNIMARNDFIVFIKVGDVSNENLSALAFCTARRLGGAASAAFPIKWKLQVRARTRTQTQTQTQTHTRLCLMWVTGCIFHAGSQQAELLYSRLTSPVWPAGWGECGGGVVVVGGVLKRRAGIGSPVETHTWPVASEVAGNDLWSCAVALWPLCCLCRCAEQLVGDLTRSYTQFAPVCRHKADTKDQVPT